MKKIYTVVIESTRYRSSSENMTLNIAAGSLKQAADRAKKFMSWHHEIVSVTLIARLDE